MRVRFSPSKKNRMVLHVFAACSVYVAHRQFLGPYPRLLSILSRVVLGGGSPMSLSNAANEFRQRAQTLIPLPPYLCQFRTLLFSQRCLIAFHAAYALVFVLPCVKSLFLFDSASRHPHDWVRPQITWRFWDIT
jgi:hypothetical protein